MNRDEVKFILRAYRSDHIDGNDPQFQLALDLARNDPDLARWLEEEEAVEAAFARKIRDGIKPPPDLAQRLLALRPTRERSWWQNRSAWFAIAASVTLLLAASTAWWPQNRRKHEAAAFRSAMARAALDLSPKHIDVAGLDGEPLRRWLSEHRGDPDFVVPPGLSDQRVVACKLIDWHGAKVTMLCFQVGTGHLDLFVADAARVPALAGNGRPTFGSVGEMNAATWTRDGKIYLLLGAQSVGQLQRFI